MATTVGLVHLRLNVSEARSLKDKRRVLKSLKDRLSANHNVSVAEVDARDSRQQAVLAVAMVGSDGRYVEGALQKVVNLVGQHRDMVLIEHEIELF